MHPGFFNVLHDSADHHVPSIAQRVNIHFRGFFQKLINQNRARRAHQRRLRHVFLHGIDVISDHHGAAAQNIAGTHQNWHANLGGNARSFLWN